MSDGPSKSAGRWYSCRNVLKTGAVGVGTAGVLSLSGSVSAWDLIPVDLRCPSCEFLGKVEFSDDATEINDTQENGVRKVDENTVEIDADLDGGGTTAV